MIEENKIPANTERRYEITTADLPLCCPTPQMKIWNAHPRVYLPIDKTGKETCPYCGAEFILKNGDNNSNEHR